MATPEGWRELPVSDLLELETPGFWGTAPVGAGDVPVVRATNLRSGTIHLDLTNVALRSFPQRKLTQKRLRCGDLVLERSGGGPKQPVGRIAIFERADTFSVSNFMQLLRPNKSQVVPRWLAYALNSLHTTGVTERLQQATTGIRNLHYRDYLAHTVLLPPLPEQRKIAAILSSVDETIEKTEAVIAQLQLVKKAMMQELLTRGMPGRHTRFKQTDIGEIPEEWDVVKLGHLILRGPDNGIYRHASEYGDGTPIVRIDAFDAGDELRTGNLRRVRLNDESVSRYGLKPGDIVINRVNSLTHIGKAALVTELVEATVFESNMMRLSVDATLVTPRFAHLWISGEFARQFFRSNAKQAVAQASINQDDVRSLPFPVPPVSEQEAIVDTLAAVTSMMASENRSLGASLGLKRSLSAALLSGDLRVAPDPSEQPAQPA